MNKKAGESDLPVRIPKSALAAELEEVRQLKWQMAEMLRQLEAAASGSPVEKPGTWRHNTARWLQRFKKTS